MASSSQDDASSDEVMDNFSSIAECCSISNITTPNFDDCGIGRVFEPLIHCIYFLQKKSFLKGIKLVHTFIAQKISKQTHEFFAFFFDCNRLML